MNAKEQIIDIIQESEHSFKQLLKIDLVPRERETVLQRIKDMQLLITATEQAIFDVPSEEEIEKYAMKHSTGCYIDFIAGVNFILNYKKPEPDGK